MSKKKIDQSEANQLEESQSQLEALKLNDKVDEAALKKAFPNFNDYVQFVSNLINYYEARKSTFNRIERIILKEKDHEQFNEIQE
ncbi:12420_t:CDS:2 [Dentiscutata heterogama]|uniref:12420_t:CDS:1 n=1 Tax=Dentiscutata heterogama TaxID=1316150 RepID=A0ACA9NY49_9GLOM|nr:12420_t:CDS:2 [Dentiscutata heterogama]